jgi:hypothetical protein
MHSYLIWTSLLIILRSLVLFRSAFLRPIHLLVQSRNGHRQVRRSHDPWLGHFSIRFCVEDLINLALTLPQNHLRLDHATNARGTLIPLAPSCTECARLFVDPAPHVPSRKVNAISAHHAALGV